MPFTIFRTELNPDGSVGEIHLTGQISKVAQRMTVANAARFAVLITNTGDGDLFIGNTSAVSTSGANVGTKVLPGDSHELSGRAAYKGDLWGIYSITVSASNIDVVVKT